MESPPLPPPVEVQVELTPMIELEYLQVEEGQVQQVNRQIGSMSLQTRTTTEEYEETITTTIEQVQQNSTVQGENHQTDGDEEVLEMESKEGEIKDGPMATGTLSETNENKKELTADNGENAGVKETKSDASPPVPAVEVTPAETKSQPQNSKPPKKEEVAEPSSGSVSSKVDKFKKMGTEEPKPKGPNRKFEKILKLFSGNPK